MYNFVCMKMLVVYGPQNFIFVMQSFMRLDIESLRTFRTVLELGAITGAAQRLNLTPSQP